MYQLHGFNSFHSQNLHKDLETLHATAPDIKVQIPPEIIQYVDDSRNPDIYTREFVEMARRQNQLMKGKAEAFASFRDVLAEQMWTALPELQRDVKEVVNQTGGNAKAIEDRVTAAARERVD
jgi:mediator of RNA polymerase II transcription subunit 10